MIHEFEFPWSKPPLSLNYRMHRMQAANLTKEIRGLMHAKARHLPDMGRCVVELEWFVNTRTKRDSENPISTFKAMCDGLVDAEIVPDDTPRYMVKLMPRITFRPKSEGPPCMVLRIAEIPDDFQPDTVELIANSMRLGESQSNTRSSRMETAPNRVVEHSPGPNPSLELARRG